MSDLRVMDVSWPLIIAGALVGLSVGLTGMGGGALMTPILVLGFGISPSAAVGSDLAASVAMKPVGALVHHRARTVRWDVVRWLLPTALPAAFGGAFLISRLSDGQAVQEVLKLAIGGALLLAVAGIFARMVLARRDRWDPADPAPVRPVAVLLIGLVGGVIVGITSVGSGSLIIVMLMLTHPRLRANELVGTDLVQAIPLVTAAAAGHLIFGDTQLGLAGAVLLGAIPGIYLGARLATRAPDGLLRPILAILLLGSGLAMWGVHSLVVLVACGGMAVVAAVVGYTRRRSRSTGGQGDAASAHTADELVGQRWTRAAARGKITR